MTTDKPAPVADADADFFEDQQRRRAALEERLLTVADLCDATPLQGDLGDVAYDLLRKAAARIASDRLRFARLAATPPSPDSAVREEDIAFVKRFGKTWLDDSVSAKTVLLAYLLKRGDAAPPAVGGEDGR